MQSYMQIQADHTLFIKHSTKGKITTLIVYVDIVLTCNDDGEIHNLNHSFANEFEIKDLGMGYLSPKGNMLGCKSH